MNSATRARKVDAEVAAWNEANPEGTAVVLTKDDGTQVHTRTRSVAWSLSGHTAVVIVDGIAGGYLLSRVRRVPSEGTSS